MKKIKFYCVGCHATAFFKAGNAWIKAIEKDLFWIAKMPCPLCETLLQIELPMIK